jgi:4'-phosphopantetheinyl transferase
LRLLLAAEIEVAPQDLQFDYGPHGKPCLGGAFAKTGVHFNLSHSDDLALVGVIRGVPLGVDLEATRPLAAHERLARRHFSRQEFSAYAAAPLPQRAAAFFNCWTRKEALLKAQGQSLAAAAAHATAPQQSEWSSMNFDAAPGFSAAVAVHRRNCDLKAEAPASSRVRLGPDSA